MEYRDFTLRRLQIAEPPKSDKIKITFLARRNYQAYLNHNGQVTRKWVNEQELVDALKTAFPDYELQVVDFGKMSYRAQIESVISCQVFVGVHGAGLSHALFLPQNGVLLEAPAPGRGNHFPNIASNSKHKALSLKGRNQGQDVFLPPAELIAKVKKAVEMGKEM
jgi:protein O-GlcNAc transferase